MTVIKNEAAFRLAQRFWNLSGKQEKYRNETIAGMWEAEFRRILNQPSATEDYIMEVMAWLFKHPHWSRRVYIAKHLSDNWNDIQDQFEADKRAAKLDAKKKDQCLCVRNSFGEIISDKIGPIYEYSCPLHGKNSGTYLRCRMQDGKMIPGASEPRRVPRYGEPGFDEHVKAMRAVLREAEDRYGRKLPSVPENEDQDLHSKAFEIEED